MAEIPYIDGLGVVHWGSGLQGNQNHINQIQIIAFYVFIHLNEWPTTILCTESILLWKHIKRLLQAPISAFQENIKGKYAHFEDR